MARKSKVNKKRGLKKSTKIIVGVVSILAIIGIVIGLLVHWNAFETPTTRIKKEVLENTKSDWKSISTSKGDEISYVTDNLSDYINYLQDDIDKLNNPETIEPEDWKEKWRESYEFWGGLTSHSFSKPILTDKEYNNIDPEDAVLSWGEYKNALATKKTYLKRETNTRIEKLKTVYDTKHKNEEINRTTIKKLINEKWYVDHFCKLKLMNRLIEDPKINLNLTLEKYNTIKLEKEKVQTLKNNIIHIYKQMNNYGVSLKDDYHWEVGSDTDDDKLEFVGVTKDDVDRLKEMYLLLTSEPYITYIKNYTKLLKKHYRENICK